MKGLVLVKCLEQHLAVCLLTGLLSVPPLLLCSVFLCTWRLLPLTAILGGTCLPQALKAVIYPTPKEMVSLFSFSHSWRPRVPSPAWELMEDT